MYYQRNASTACNHFQQECKFHFACIYILCNLSNEHFTSDTINQDTLDINMKIY